MFLLVYEVRNLSIRPSWHESIYATANSSASINANVSKCNRAKCYGIFHDNFHGIYGM